LGEQKEKENLHVANYLNMLLGHIYDLPRQ
jgi:hypothetical protein